MLRPYVIPALHDSRPRQPQRKRAPFSHGALHLDPPALQLGKQARNRQAEPRSAELAAARLVDPKEPIEHPFHMLGSDAGTSDADTDPHLLAIARERKR